MLRTTTIILLVRLSLHYSVAQDSHYWSSNYSPGGLMTPGATIADTKDSGVFFYNPALLAIRPKTALEFSGSLYQIESTRIIDALGKGKDLKSVSGGISPQMHSGSFKLKQNERLVLAYALINNYILNNRVNQRQDTKMNVLNDAYSPGSEYYIGQFSEVNQVSEISGVFSAGFKLSEKLYVGASLEAQVRRKTFDIEYSGRALLNQAVGAKPLLFPDFSNTEAVYRVDYTQMGLKPKIGLAYNQARHHVGLLATLPLMRVFSRGMLMTDYVVSNIRLVPTVEPINLLANTRQEKLTSNYKTPFSLAAGYSYDYGRGHVYLAAEYFARLKDYAIITPRNDYFIRSDTSGSSSTSTANSLKLKDVRKAVMNVAVGISFPVKPSVMGYVSIRTDFSYADEKSFADTGGYVAYTTNWNSYHAQLGANIRRPKFSFRPGLLLSYGTTNAFKPEVNFDTPNESNLLLGDPVNAKVNHVVIGLLLAYIHNL
ncbi:hypothetical protein [Spirosoma endbachense]|uniref:Aromatic hydrocarbon degradation protein n=1 Tax=Spirosoma endbachense TaxID=2666025 RepID=A0A6P1W781_9BACT|nr:hypothetical protein [Spirosoma endbachense]QHV99566.1 hypothetical protein GJR95_33170 [Spirosoma endbachense]